MRVFVAGATGVIGRRLVPLLHERGHEVTATTTSPARREDLAALGAEPVVMDGLDAASVRRAVARAEPQAIVHQMTALAGAQDLRRFDRWFARTNELRTVGTDNLLAAACAAGVDRFVAQSYTGWTNSRTGGVLKTEDDPLDPQPARAQRRTLEAIRYLEDAVLGAPLRGTVLRYGAIYGPGPIQELVAMLRRRRLPIVGDGGGVWSWIHVDDAARATVVALERGARGVFNVVDDEPAPASEWLTYLASVAGAPTPVRIPVWLARLAAGEVAVRWMTNARGSSNAKVKAALGWQPIWRSWREGFQVAVAGDLDPRVLADA